jgi:hypothetical protein
MKPVLDVDLPEVHWTDHSQRPVVGMLVTAYFEGEQRTMRLTEWRGDIAYFQDRYGLRWNEGLGFSYRSY